MCARYSAARLSEARDQHALSSAGLASAEKTEDMYLIEEGSFCVGRDSYRLRLRNDAQPVTPGACGAKSYCYFG